MDLEIRRFEEELVECINRSELPIEVRRLVVQEICNKVSKAANENIYEQRRQKIEKGGALKEGEKDAESAQ